MIDVSYNDDYGTKAGSKATVAQLGLEVGGKFADFKRAILMISGEFAPACSSVTAAVRRTPSGSPGPSPGLNRLGRTDQ